MCSLPSDDDADDADAAAEAEEETAAPDNPLVVDLRPKDLAARQKAALWFQKDVFEGLEGGLLEEGLELEAAAEDYRRQGGKVLSSGRRPHRPPS